MKKKAIKKKVQPKTGTEWYDYVLGIPYALAILLAAFFIVFFVAAMLPHGADAEQVSQHRNIMGYLTIPLYSPDVIEFLDANEQAHMWDVKAVFNWAFIALLFFVGFSMIFPSMVAKRTSAGIIAGIAVITLIAALINARDLWTRFHKIFFPQGGWVFPRESTLISLYPGTYFAGFAIAVFLVAAAICGLLNWHYKAPKTGPYAKNAGKKTSINGKKSSRQKKAHR